MATPILFPLNILETSTLIVPGVASGYPKERMVDRDRKLPYRDSASGTRTYKGDQGATLIQDVNAWGLAGHNLSSVSLTLESSINDSAWTVRDTHTPGATDFIRTALTGGLITARYWRVTATSAPAAPEIGEWVLTRSRTLVNGYLSEEGMRHGVRPNVGRAEGYSGKTWWAQRGAERWFAEYPLLDLTTADKTTLETAFTEAKGGANPFFILDADGVLRWAEWDAMDGLDFVPMPVNRWDTMQRFLAAL